MKCPYCASENPDNNKYCGNCGKAISPHSRRRYNLIIAVFFIWMTLAGVFGVISTSMGDTDYAIHDFMWSVVLMVTVLLLLRRRR